MSAINKIEQLIACLPEKDIPIAHKYLEKRDFESLRELVVSAEYKVRKSLSSENPKEEYLNINMEKLEDLRYRVLEYSSQFDYEPIEIDYLNEDL